WRHPTSLDFLRRTYSLQKINRS
ncbi:hypothetical protein MYU51_002615, partial [Penicillium brevicompactum]